MSQSGLLEPDDELNDHVDIGQMFRLRFSGKQRCLCDVYFRGSLFRRANLNDKAEVRLLVVDLMKAGANQTRLAEALQLSRQTLHNYYESYKAFGINGLLHGYSPSDSKNEERQRQMHAKERRPGSKARELEALRQTEWEKAAAAARQNELAWEGDPREIYSQQEPTPVRSEDVAAVMSDESSGATALTTATEMSVESPRDEADLSPLAPSEVVTNPSPESAHEGIQEATGTTPSVMTNDLTADQEVAATTDQPGEEAAAPAMLPPQAPGKTIEVPYEANHGWMVNRYAGVFTVLMMLISRRSWLMWLFKLFGSGWRLFSIFTLMTTRDIRSIEQLKHERCEEVGQLLGFSRMPCLDTIWGWFHEAADKHQSATLLTTFFDDQIRKGLVGARLWFTDGHLLPYTGQEKVHSAWSTQRRMPTPGQTNMVTCDEQGRVVYFDIQEGKGDLRAHILQLSDYAKQQPLGAPPVHVFDREGDGLEFFSEMVRRKAPFITWEKNVNQPRLTAFQEGDFCHEVTVNGTDYRLLEEKRECVYPPPATNADAHGEVDAEQAATSHRFELRRIVAWNLRTQHRVSILCWDGELKLPPEMVATGMLSRWGASENTFKHIQERHPYHYRPGFAVSESEKQDIANPQIKQLAQQIGAHQAQLAKLYKKHAKNKPMFNKDGSERMNSQYRRIKNEITEAEAALKRLQSEKAQLPERINVAGLADYRSFKTISKEGKNLFDFVTTSVWNSRRQLLDWLEEVYPRENDRVDLLYAIFNCQGWVRTDETWVVVRLEPLQQPSRRYAQEHLCRKLNGLAARIPAGKWLRIEVGPSPV